MRNLLVIFGLLGINTFVIFSQIPDIKYYKIYNFPGMTGGLSIAKTSDDGVIITGQHENGPAGSCDVYLCKVSKCGNVEWYKTFGSSGSDGGMKVNIASNGDILVAGLWDETGGNSYEYLLQRFNANGNHIFSRVIDNGGDDRAHWITELSNGNLAVCGSFYISGHWNAVFSLFDANGNHILSKMINHTKDNNFSSIRQSGNYLWLSGYIVDSHTWGDGQDILIAKTDLSGNVIWCNRYFLNGTEGGYWNTEGVPTPDGGYVIASQSDVGNTGGETDIFLMKVDANGNILWTNKYRGTQIEAAEGITLTPDNGFAIIGYTYSFTHGDRDGFVIKTDSVGNLEWAKAYGGGGADRAIEIAMLGNKKYIISMNQDVGGGDYDPVIINTDSAGNCGCNEINAPFIQGTLTGFTIFNYNIINSNPTPQIITPSASTLTPNENVVCISCNPQPPQFTVSDSILCAGQVFTVTTTNSPQQTCLTWYQNGNYYPATNTSFTLSYSTPGTQTITLQTACGNNVASTSKTVEVYAPITLGATTQSVLCYNTSTGASTVNVNGGATPYSYTWNPNVSASTVAVNLPTGTYTFIATDNGACGTVSTVINIPQPSAPVSVTAAITQTVSCHGGNDGILNSTVSGGMGTYSYTWTSTTTTVGNLNSVSGLSTGVYTVLVSDINNCTAQDVIFLPEPAPVQAVLSTNSITCHGYNNGAATVTPSGGTGTYSIYWSNGAMNTTSVNNLPPGNYTVAVIDNNNCGPVTQTFTILEPTQMTITTSYTNASCYGYSDGMITSTVTGGMNGYSYSWTPTGSTSSNLTGVPAGTYTLSVTDANGCISQTTVNISQPSQVLLSTTPPSTICYGNSTYIYANPSGGTPPYTHTWSQSFTGAGPHLVSPTVTTIYTVSVIDANNCPSLVYNINVTVLPPLTITPSSIWACDKDTVTLVPNLTLPGNGGPYTYLWDMSSSNLTYTVIANYSTNPNTHTLTVSDGCTIPDATGVYTVNVYPLPTATISSNLVNGCVPLSINVAATSTISSNYNWFFTNGVDSLYASGSPANVVFTSSGLYTLSLHIEDINGCKNDTSISNYFDVYPLPIASFVAQPQMTTEINPIIQFLNSSIGATTYNWYFGDGSTMSNEFQPYHFYNDTGTYLVRLVVYNTYGCVDSTTGKVIINPDFHVYIPNIFTPDENGLNDVFNIKGTGISPDNFVMRIFDRWGQIIYQTNDINEGWNGKFKGAEEIVKDGVYTYYILLDDYKGDQHKYIGHITVQKEGKEQ